MNTDFEKLIADADNGNAAAQVEVARAYEFGNAPGGINYDLCYKYNKMAADQGDSWGENNVGWCYEKGYGVPVDYEEAVRWYRKSADKGNGYGASNLAHMYICELGVAFDAEAFVKYTCIGADAGVPGCQYNLGCEYLTGKVIERNVEEAQKWIEAAAKNGHQGAKQMLENANGDLSTWELIDDVVQEGIKTIQNGQVDMGLSMIHSEVDKGNPDAIFVFAQVITELLNGEKYFVVEQNNQKIVCIEDPEGKPREDGQPALKGSFALPANAWVTDPNDLCGPYIRKAAELGHPEARLIVEEADGGTESENLTDEEFFERKMKAANEGDADAMNSVAIAYAEGNGVEQHLSNAVMWWKKAADGGNANAFLNLGIYYSDKEPSAAIRYLETAVEKGVALAYFHLGLIYWKREDREPDLNTAYQYMGAAAKCGIGDAQEAMKVIEAEFHNNGNGGAQNSGCMVLIVAVITCAVGCLFALA